MYKKRELMYCMWGEVTLSDWLFVLHLVEGGGARFSLKKLSGKLLRKKNDTHWSDSALILIFCSGEPPQPLPRPSDAESLPGSAAVVRSSDRLLILAAAAEGYLSSPPSGSQWSVVHTGGFQQPSGPKPGWAEQKPLWAIFHTKKKREMKHCFVYQG